MEFVLRLVRRCSPLVHSGLEKREKRWWLDSYRLKFGGENDKIHDMSERKIGVIVDEGDTGLTAMIKSDGSTKLEISFNHSDTPEMISEALLTYGAKLKYDRGLIRLGDMLIYAADKVPGLTVVDGYQQITGDNRALLEAFSESTRSISSVGIINADSENNSENNGDNHSAILEVVRW